MTSNNLCRLCICEAPINFLFFDENTANMLESLTSIKIRPSDEFCKLCIECSEDLKLAYNIQQKFVKADEILKVKVATLISAETVIKQEKDDEVLIKQENTSIAEVCSFVCEICDKSVEEHLRDSHMNNHFNNNKFCNLCKQNFCDEETYKNHLVEHTKHTIFYCYQQDDKKFLHNIDPQKTEHNDCNKNKEASDKTEEKIQIENINPEPPTRRKYQRKPRFDPLDIYSCTVCSKKFTDRNQWKKHTHERRDCPLCKKSITYRNYHKHVRTHTSGPQVCEHCGKVFGNIERLRGHYFNQHRGILYECEECKITFNNRQGLSNHRRRKHMEASHVCEHCGQKFRLAYSLRKHIEGKHLKMRPYECEFCKKGFSGLYALKTHRRQHTNETPYKCEVCGEGFRQNVSLRSHRKSQHAIVEAETCKCDICEKGFGSEHALQVHMRCH